MFRLVTHTIWKRTNEINYCTTYGSVDLESTVLQLRVTSILLVITKLRD
jgi:hypothetical protein